jgi:hypothetical protein
MPIRRRLPLWLLAAALLAAGCISHKGAARPETPAVTPPTTDASPSYYTANFTCSAEGMTANGQLRMQTDSIIWLSASKVIELGRARFTHDSVIIHAKITGQCVRGDYNDLYRRFNFRTDFDQLAKTLTAPAPQAEKQLADIAQLLGIEATFTLQPWQKVDKLTFPIPIPNNAKPL